MLVLRRCRRHETDDESMVLLQDVLMLSYLMLLTVYCTSPDEGRCEFDIGLLMISTGCDWPTNLKYGTFKSLFDLKMRTFVKSLRFLCLVFSICFYNGTL